MYKVIHFFTDLQDFNHPYSVGETFPRDGFKVSKERIEELSGPNNRQGKPLIELVNEPINKESALYSKTEINRMPIAELRLLAKNEGIAGCDKKSGAELKKILIEKYGL